MHHRIAWLAAALCIATAAPAFAMGKETYKAQKQRIEAEYDAAQARCKSHKGVARDVCSEQARGSRDVAVAELEMQAKPTPENDEKLRMARADAVYAVSLERCEPLDRRAREVCRKDARAVHAAARVEAKIQKEAAAVHLKADRVARDRGNVDQRQVDAQYAAAQERCAMLPPEGRDNCLADARRRFNKI